mmetsp:Transcript_20099/g.66870  ORF Transcript_20099/g.66870 Transcript_20099/m.66870 type:complete len:115 (+) Transcript_20099:2014-2358(+)
MFQKEPVAVRFLRRVSEHELQEYREKCVEADKDSEGVISLEEFMEIISPKLTGFSENDIMELVKLTKVQDRCTLLGTFMRDCIAREFRGGVNYVRFFDALVREGGRIYSCILLN